jgi:hypothetical protein
MGYGLHIERRTSDGTTLPITLEEWLEAVEATPGIRLADGPLQLRNPMTGEIITVQNAGGDVEVYFQDEWVRVFFWTPAGLASFRATAETEHPDSEIRRAARALAKKLDADVVGDEGETYK